MSISNEIKPDRLDRGRIASLDGLRAVAVILVLIAHASKTVGFVTSETLRDALGHGAIGVEIFFVISGFLITNLLLREVDRTGKISIKDFYIRRALRILPAYICYLFVLFLLTLVGYVALNHQDWALALTYTINFIHKPTWQVGHIWSLSIEEHFYLIWPLIMVLGGPKLGRSASIFFIIFCFIARWVVLLAFPHNSVDSQYYTQMAERWTFTRMDTISFGCLLALLTWDKSWRDRLDGLFTRNAWLPTALTWTLLFSMFIISRSGKGSVGICYTLNSFLIAMLLWYVIRAPESLVGRFLNHWTISAIGVMSYSLYLWQQIFLNRYSDLFAYRFPQNLVFAVMAAAVSYLVIERPFLKLKARLADRRHGAVDVKPVHPAPTPTVAAASLDHTLASPDMA